MAKRGFPGGMGGFNMGGGMGGGMGGLMKQFQKMQQDIQKVQEQLAEMTVEATAGGGAVTVIASGSKEIREIKLNPEVVDADDVEMLQDLLIAAVNEALRKSEELSAAEMGKVTGGMSMPGLF